MTTLVTDEAWWPWVTEVIIPASGVLASTAVAIVAIFLGTRDRRSDKRELEKAARAEFAELLKQFVRSIARSGGMSTTPPELLMAASARLSPPMTSAVDWAAVEIWRVRGSLQSPGVMRFDQFVDEADRRTDEWLGGDTFNLARL